MPLTALDPTAALIVIDLQNGIVGLPLAHPPGEIVARAVRLAREFRERRLTVVLVNVNAGAPGRTDLGPPNLTRAPDWAELVTELEPQPGDVLITKQRWGAFTGTQLDQELKQRGVTQVFMTGIATTRGVESTARSAFELGYHVVLVTDAMTDRSAEAHANSIERIFPSLGETTTTAQVLEFLSARRA